MFELNQAVYQLSDDKLHYKMKEIIKVKYRECIQVQLDNWIKGINEHTKDLPNGIEPECCPDFSCCQPELEWSLELKQRFLKASSEDRETMLLNSLFNMIKHTEPNAKVLLLDSSTIN